MNDEILERVILALRDTADKTTEEVVEQHKREKRTPYGYSEGEETFETRHEKYTRDWIAGRLLGMADMVEAIWQQRRMNESEDAA